MWIYPRGVLRYRGPDVEADRDIGVDPDIGVYPDIGAYLDIGVYPDTGVLPDIGVRGAFAKFLKSFLRTVVVLLNFRVHARLPREAGRSRSSGHP